MLRDRFAAFWSLVNASPFRSALAALAILTPSAALLAMFIGAQVNQLLADRTIDTLQEELKSLRLELDRGGIAALTAAVQTRSDPPGRGLYHLEVGDGAQPGPATGNLQGMPLAPGTGSGIFQTFNSADGRMHTAVGLVVPVPGGSLLVARDIEDQRAFAANLQRTAFLGVAAMSVIALGLGWIGSLRTLRRITGIDGATRSIMAGDLSRRLPLDQSGDEIDRMSAGVNAMLSRIEDLMQALREVSDNIAHDLKTPLTRLRNRAEAALADATPAAHRDGLERVIEEADGLIQTFNALLLIARLEAGAIDDTRTECDLAQLVSEVAELYQPVADDAGLSITIDARTPAPLAVNRQLVGQAVANLLDNAIKFSSATSSAAVGPISVAVVPLSAQQVQIVVADHGPGIPAADRERAIRRFVRLEQSRSRPGTGLGLSLVAAVARLHGGEIRLEDNRPGLRVVCVLAQPSARPSVAPSAPGASADAAPLASVAG